MNALTIVLSSIVSAPLALIAASAAVAVWLARPSEQRLQLANDEWQLSRVALDQRAPTA